MPTYEYECEACGHTFEEFQSITAAPLKKCPACKKNKLKRLFGTGAAVLFKGSGFYTTDYRSDSYKKAQKEDKPSESSSDKTADTTKTSSESKSSSSTKPKPSKGKSPKPKK